jgi:hypothetical protein
MPWVWIHLLMASARCASFFTPAPPLASLRSLRCGAFAVSRSQAAHPHAASARRALRAMADATSAAAPPERVCVPRFLFIMTARRADSSRCRLCGTDIAVGEEIAKLDSGLRHCAPLVAQLKGYPLDGWSHSACWATARAWRVRAGLERPPAAWDAPDAALTPEERRAAAALADGAPELAVPRARACCVGAAFWAPSPHQVALYRQVLEGTGHIVVDAKAGSGKTSSLAAATTLVCWTSSYPCSFAAKSEGPLVLAFNRHNMADLLAALARDAAEVRTFHSPGLSLWQWMARSSGGSMPRARLVPKKTQGLLLARLPDVRAPGGATARDRRYTLLKPFVLLAVSLAKCWALGCAGGAAAHTPEGWRQLVAHFGRTLTRPLAAAADKQPAGDAQQRRYTSAELLDMGLALAHAVYSDSLVAALRRGEWDFDDMLLAPLALDDAPLRAAVGAGPPGEAAFAWHPRQWVLVDEAQDLNPARRLVLRKLLRPGGRLLAVGDPAQALYGFTGAHAGGLASLAGELGAARLALPVCYRCPTAHVAAAAALLGAHEGELVARAGAPAGHIQACAARIALDALGPEGAAVLCRGNAELLQLYLALLRRGAPCRLVGVAAVNGALHALLGAALRKRVAPAAQARLTAPQLADAIRAHAAAKRARRDAAAAAAGAAAGANDATKADADDYAQCLLALLAETEERAAAAAEAPLAGAALLDALRAVLDACYKPGAKDRKPWQDDADTEEDDAPEGAVTVGAGVVGTPQPSQQYAPRRGELVLCTVHKAKGREWDTVYLLQPGRMAGAHAAVATALAADADADVDAEASGELQRLHREGAPWEATAERNVTYVALTRARRTLALLRDADDPWCFDADALLPPLRTPATAAAARAALATPAPPAKRLPGGSAAGSEEGAGDDDAEEEEVEGPASAEMRRTSPVAARGEAAPAAKRRLL